MSIDCRNCGIPMTVFSHSPEECQEKMCHECYKTRNEFVDVLTCSFIDSLKVCMTNKKIGDRNMETNLYRNKADKSMWIRLPTGEIDKETGKKKYKSFTVGKLVPEFPDVVWKNTASGTSEVVAIDLDKFEIDIDAIPWSIPAVVTSGGVTLSPERSGVRDELILKSKTA